ncbi:MAG TPA: hypothetical protein DDY82_04320 [Clostridiales bacterium]|nr:hypothetical protein [Clostridiales bacterium]
MLFKENTMKKIISIALTLILALSVMTFIGCKKDSGVSNKETTFVYELKKNVDEDGNKDDYYVIRGFKVSDEDADKMEDGEIVKKEMVVPATYNNLPVREILEGALKNQKIITKLSFEKNADGTFNIQTINSGAFAGCVNLTEIELPFIGKSADAVNEEKVFGYVFGEEQIDGCTSVEQSYNSGTDTKTYYIPSSLTTVTLIGNKLPIYAFCGNTVLKKIVLNSSVTAIPEGAFKGCTALDEIVLPDSVTKIGDDAFNGCTGLYGIDFNKVTTIGNNAFKGCTKLGFGENELIISSTVETLGESAFEGCTTISKLSIACLEISRNAFFGCSELTYVNLTCLNGGTIKSMAFMNCDKLKAENVKNLGIYAVESNAFDFNNV